MVWVEAAGRVNQGFRCDFESTGYSTLLNSPSWTVKLATWRSSGQQHDTYSAAPLTPHRPRMGLAILPRPPPTWPVMSRHGAAQFGTCQVTASVLPATFVFLVDLFLARRPRAAQASLLKGPGGPPKPLGQVVTDLIARPPAGFSPHALNAPNLPPLQF